jgi:hypothetical protein
MKTVFRNHNEVCHIWASQKQDSGRSGNISFDNGTIYSYGWWPMATFIEPDVVLFRDAKYSVSTSQHQSLARSAVSHCAVFDVIDLDGDHQKNIDNYLLNARVKANSFWASQLDAEWIFESWQNIIKQAREYAKHFNCQDLLPALFGYELLGQKAHNLINSQTTKRERKQAEYEARRKAALEKFSKLRPGRLVKWLNGERLTGISIDGFWFRDFEHTMLRYKPDTDEIETNMGAVVPAKAGRILYSMIKAGKPVHGHQIGHYTVKGYNGSLKVGCHEILRSEIDRFAKSMKWD